MSDRVVAAPKVPVWNLCPWNLCPADDPSAAMARGEGSRREFRVPGLPVRLSRNMRMCLSLHVLVVHAPMRSAHD